VERAPDLTLPTLGATPNRRLQRIGLCELDRCAPAGRAAEQAGGSRCRARASPAPGEPARWWGALTQPRDVRQPRDFGLRPNPRLGSIVAVNGTARQSNPGTGLLGGNYSVRSRSAPTEDGDGAARWIALDESGHHGDQQFRESRYMALGVVKIDDASAVRVIEQLRRGAESSKAMIQAEELSFGTSFAGAGAGKARRRSVLAELLGAGGALEGRVSAYLVDADYFVASKLVDLLIEETLHNSGAPWPGAMFYRTLARDLTLEGPRALGMEGHAQLIATAATFFSKKNRHGDLVSVEQLFTVFRNCRNRSRRRTNPRVRRVTEVLELLLRTRHEAEQFALAHASDPSSQQADAVRDSMEPLIPAVVAAISTAAERHESVGALGDEHRLLTDGTLELMELGVNAQVVLKGLYEQHKLAQLVRGTSGEHPSLQLADLAAGAALAVARHCNGEDKFRRASNCTRRSSR
jgi:hypothetical protein